MQITKLGLKAPRQKHCRAVVPLYFWAITNSTSHAPTLPQHKKDPKANKKKAHLLTPVMPCFPCSPPPPPSRQYTPWFGAYLAASAAIAKPATPPATPTPNDQSAVAATSVGISSMTSHAVTTRVPGSRDEPEASPENSRLRWSRRRSIGVLHLVVLVVLVPSPQLFRADQALPQTHCVGERWLSPPLCTRRTRAADRPCAEVGPAVPLAGLVARRAWSICVVAA